MATAGGIITAGVVSMQQHSTSGALIQLSRHPGPPFASVPYDDVSEQSHSDTASLFTSQPSDSQCYPTVCDPGRATATALDWSGSGESVHPMQSPPPAAAAVAIHGSKAAALGRGGTKSLHTLTTRFTQLIQSAPDHCLDLNKACDMLGLDVTKRRLYDITNVLEGCGLIKKVGKSAVQWLGAIGDEDGCRHAWRLRLLQQEQLQLQAAEMRLEVERNEALKLLRVCKEDAFMREFAYVTQRDIRDGFGDDTCLTVHAPCGTQLEVPIPTNRGRGAGGVRCQIHLQSDSAPIHVLLVNGGAAAGDDTVAAPVPVDSMSTSGGSVRTSGNDVRTGGNDVRTSGNDVRTSGNDVRTSGNDVRASGNDVRTSGNDVRAGGDEVRTSGNDASTTEDCVRTNEDSVKSSEGGVKSSGEVWAMTGQEPTPPIIPITPPPHREYFNLTPAEGICDLFDISPNTSDSR